MKSLVKESLWNCWFLCWKSLESETGGRNNFVVTITLIDCGDFPSEMWANQSVWNVPSFLQREWDGMDQKRFSFSPSS